MGLSGRGVKSTLAMEQLQPSRLMGQSPGLSIEIRAHPDAHLEFEIDCVCIIHPHPRFTGP